MIDNTKEQSIKGMGSVQTDTLVVNYGRRIFLRLLSRCENQDMARQASKEALVEIYKAMKTSGCNHPLDAMRYILSNQDETLSKTIIGAFEDVLEENSAQPFKTKREAKKPILSEDVTQTQPHVQAARPELIEEQKPIEPPPPFAAKEPETVSPQPTVTEEESENVKKRKPVFFSILIVLILFAGIFAMLWVIAGLLMATGIIPMMDLGYSWFNGFVFPLF